MSLLKVTPTWSHQWLGSYRPTKTLLILGHLAVCEDRPCCLVEQGMASKVLLGPQWVRSPVHLPGKVASSDAWRSGTRDGEDASNDAWWSPGLHTLPPPPLVSFWLLLPLLSLDFCLYGPSPVGPGWGVGWGESVCRGGGEAVIFASYLRVRKSHYLRFSLSHLASALLIGVYQSPPAAVRPQGMSSHGNCHLPVSSPYLFSF